MPRRLRVAMGGMAFHVLNRAAGRGRLFQDEQDYLAMLRSVAQTHQQLPMRIAAYCLMPTHWHLVVWPREDGDLSEFMRLLTVTHAQRWHAFHRSAGTGPVYQGRYRSFPIQRDDHFLTVCRYVERNAVRANLVRSARRWPWCSLAARATQQPPSWLLPTKQWPVHLPTDWAAWVDRAETAAELTALRRSANRGRPYGDDRWERQTAEQLDLESTLRPRGRQQIRPIKDSRPL
jgi:putative transposase